MSRLLPLALLVSVVLASLLCTAAVVAQQPAPAPATVLDTRPAAEAGATDAAEAAADSEKGEYQELVARAVTEFDSARYAEARALFMRAHELWPSARTLRVLGMTSFELRNYVRALRELRAALTDKRRELSDEHRRTVEALIEQTRAFVGSYRVRLSPSSAVLLVDGTPATLDDDGLLVLEVGNHELLARAAGHRPMRMSLVIEGHEDQELTLELEPSTDVPGAQVGVSAGSPPAAAPGDAPASTSTGFVLWPWTFGGALVAGGVALTVFLVTDAQADCAPDCSDRQASAIRTGDAVWITAGAISGALAITTAFAFLYRDHGDDDSGDTVALRIGPGYVVARGSF